MGNTLAALVLSVVFQTAPVQVDITADRSEVQVQETVQLSVRALDGAGRLITDADVRWLSSTPEIASVDQTGRMMATNPGIAKITVVVILPSARRKTSASGTRTPTFQSSPLIASTSTIAI